MSQAGKCDRTETKAFLSSSHQRGESVKDDTEALTPWQRLSRTLTFATTRIEPGEPIPDVPPELREWTENTLLGLFAGLCYGGVRHYLQTRHDGRYRPPNTGLSKAQVARLTAEENTRRLIRLGNSMINLAGEGCALAASQGCSTGYRWPAV